MQAILSVQGNEDMSQKLGRRSENQRGEIVLLALRLTLMAAAAALIGVLGHVAWKIISA